MTGYSGVNSDTYNPLPGEIILLLAEIGVKLKCGPLKKRNSYDKLEESDRSHSSPFSRQIILAFVN